MARRVGDGNAGMVPRKSVGAPAEPHFPLRNPLYLRQIVRGQFSSESCVLLLITATRFCPSQKAEDRASERGWRTRHAQRATGN